MHDVGEKNRKDETFTMAEREINLIDLIADILSHWRGALICMLAGAILLGAVGSVKSYLEVKEAIAEAKAAQEELPENPEDAEGVQKLDEPSMDWNNCVKNVFLGAFLFLFAYAGVWFVRYILNGRLRAVDELQKLYDISQLGVIVQEKEKPKNVIDRWVDGLRNWNRRRFNREQSFELAATAIRISARKQELDAICLMGCELAAGADDACRLLKEKLEKEHIAVKILNNVLYDAEMMSGLEDVRGIVLVEKAMSTLYDEIVCELELVRRQGILVLGGVIVE